MSLGLIYLIDRANRFRTIAATTLYFLVNTFMRCFLHSWRAPVFIFRVIPMVFVLLLFIVWIFLLFLFLLFLFFSNCGPNTWSRAVLAVTKSIHSSSLASLLGGCFAALPPFPVR